ncbi:MAG: hypothetical protein AB1485_02110 [Candidatus Thermoplasmatota archaeon]
MTLILVPSGSYALVAWTRPWSATDDDIGVKWSTDSGSTWSSNTRVAGTSFNERHASIAADGPKAHLAFANVSNNDIWYAYSSNPANVGFSGTEINTVANVTNSTYRFCDITINTTGGPNTVWTDKRDGGLDIYFCRYKNENIRITGPTAPPPPPTSTYELTGGWNFISLTLSNATLNNASQLASAIGENCTHISNWTGTTFQTYEVATGVGNFDLEFGRGYYVHVSSYTKFTISGSKVANKALTLIPGWNSIGRFNETVTKASALATSIQNCTAIAYWNTTLHRFIMHCVNEGISDFDLASGKGYLVYVTSSSTWENS